MRYRLGDKVEITRTITEEHVDVYAKLVGDNNPIHMDDSKAMESGFHGRIVHGLLIGGILSGVIATHLPGPGTIYLEQDLKFFKPVNVGDTITAVVEIAEIIKEKKNILKLITRIQNENGDVVIDGYAIVKAPDKGGVISEGH